MKNARWLARGLVVVMGFWTTPVSASGIDEAIDAAFRPIARAMSEFVFYAVPLGGAGA